MPTFHVVPVPAAGHVNPMLPVAAELVRRGEDVTVWLAGSFAGAVRGTGATHRELPEIQTPVPRGALPDLRGFARLFRALRTPPPGLAEAVRPGDVVVYDSLSTWTRTIDMAGVTAVAFSCSTLVDGRSLSADLAGPLARLLHRDRAAVQRRLLAGPLPRLLARLPLPRTGDGPTLVSVPRSFQPHSAIFGPEAVFVGPCLEPRPGDADDPVLDGLDAEPRPIVLVSLGSAFNFRPAFYRACLRAVDRQPWRVVLTIGQHTDPAELGPPPENVTIVRRVPQLALLERAAAFVSHGGMGSVQESLVAGVPLVLFPQMAEQRANSRRVAEHGAGVVLSSAPGPDEIRAALHRVLADPTIRPAVAALGDAARAAGGRQRAADVLQEIARTIPSTT